MSIGQQLSGSGCVTYMSVTWSGGGLVEQRGTADGWVNDGWPQRRASEPKPLCLTQRRGSPLKRLRLGPSRWVVAVGGDVVSG